MAEKEESAALLCADPSAQPEIQEVSGSLDSGEPKWTRSACQDQILLQSFPLCSSYHDLVCFSYVAMGCMAPVGSVLCGVAMGCSQAVDH